MEQEDTVTKLDTGADEPLPGRRRSNFTPASPDAYERVFGAGELVGAGSPVPSDNTPLPLADDVLTSTPGSLPSPPQRRSLPDDALLTTLDTRGHPGGALAAIAQLQEELELRGKEAEEFRRWEKSMVAIGTPEALGVVEKTRVTFTESLMVVHPAASTPGMPVFPETTENSSIEGWGTVESSTEELNIEERRTEARGTMQPATEEPAVPLDAAIVDDDDVDENLPPVEPVSSPRTTEHEIVIVPDTAATTMLAFLPEETGAEPTRLEQRMGRVVQLFWFWFAAHSSLISVAFGGAMMSLGMSLRQAIVATLAGVALSFLPLGLGTLASKWNGQPTVVVSRATFGHRGNMLPSLLALVTRLFWAAVLVWILATVVADMVHDAGLGANLSQQQLVILAAGVVFFVALVVSFFGYALIARLSLALSVVSAILVVLFVVVTWPSIDLAAALSIGDGPWIVILTGTILVFSFVGLAWSTGSGDVARYQRPSNSGAVAMLVGPLGAALPSFVLIAYGALLAASNGSLVATFVADPASAFLSIVPPGFVVLVVAAVALGLVSAVVLSLYSGAFALQSLGFAVRREVAVLGVGLAVAVIVAVVTLLGLDLHAIIRDLGTSLAVPTAAWAGIFSAEVMIRNRRFDARSLVQRGGVYPDVNWVNVIMLVVCSVVGFGLTSATVSALEWQGYLFPLLGVPIVSDLAASDVGVLVALVLGLLTPIVAGTRRIRRQEQSRDVWPDTSAVAAAYDARSTAPR